jgi:hypothetical protein
MPTFAIVYLCLVGLKTRRLSALRRCGGASILSLFYYPKEVLETGEVIFDTNLVKMKVNPKNAEKVFKDAIKLLEGPCPKETCDWCKKV